MKIILTTIILGVLLMFSSCSEYLDVNDNPNQLTEVPSGDLLLKGTLLANAQVQQGHLSRVSMLYTGGLIGVRLVQQTIYNYDYTPGDSDNTWAHVYNGILVQNKEIRRISPDIGLLQGIIDVNEALAVGTATSLFGDIPYSTAIPDNPKLESPDPTLDKQTDVYAALQVLLDGAITKLQNGVGTASLRDHDNYFKGDKTKWIESAYTLKARYYLQTKEYAKALTHVVNGISKSENTMAYNPIGTVNNNSNLLYNIVNSSRAGDFTGVGTFYSNLLDTANSNSRNHSKTIETARRQYSYIDGDGEQAMGIDAANRPMKLVSYEENLLIWAECILRVNNDHQGAINKLNELRLYLNSGKGFNIIEKKPYKYDPFVLADFNNGGIENSDNVAVNRAILREIIEERYVTGYSTYMPFNDVRRLKASDSDVIVPFPLNNSKTKVHPQRLLYPQDEINGNSNIPDPIPNLFTATPVNE